MAPFPDSPGQMEATGKNCTHLTSIIELQTLQWPCSTNLTSMADTAYHKKVGLFHCLVMSCDVPTNHIWGSPLKIRPRTERFRFPTFYRQKAGSGSRFAIKGCWSGSAAYYCHWPRCYTNTDNFRKFLILKEREKDYPIIMKTFVRRRHFSTWVHTFSYVCLTFAICLPPALTSYTWS